MVYSLLPGRGKLDTVTLPTYKFPCRGYVDNGFMNFNIAFTIPGATTTHFLLLKSTSCLPMGMFGND